MKFTNMSGRAKVVYDSMWGGTDFLAGCVEPNSSRGSTTYKFKGNSKDALTIIESLFQVSNIPCFEKKYEQAVSGQGQEEEKILTLHSSSRCALLAFYNIENHPVHIMLDNKDVEFNYSVFEFKNPVIGYPSNMDIVLLSKDRKKVLFLESKFAEYYLYARESSGNISSQYATNKYSKEYYKKAWLEKIGLTSTLPEDSEPIIQKEFKLSVKENSIANQQEDNDNYLDGFKQMISHYIGIRRRIENASKHTRIAYDTDKKTKEISEEVLRVVENPDSVIYLGEILFDKFYSEECCTKVLDPKVALKRYSELYAILAQKMNDINAAERLQDRFIVLKNDLKYSEFLSSNKNAIDQKVLEFYRI